MRSVSNPHDDCQRAAAAAADARVRLTPRGDGCAE